MPEAFGLAGGVDAGQLGVEMDGSFVIILIAAQLLAPLPVGGVEGLQSGVSGVRFDGRAGLLCDEKRRYEQSGGKRQKARYRGCRDG